MRWTVGMKIALGFAVAVAIVLATAFSAYRSSTSYIENAKMRRQRT